MHLTYAVHVEVMLLEASNSIINFINLLKNSYDPDATWWNCIAGAANETWRNELRCWQQRVKRSSLNQGLNFVKKHDEK